MVNQIILAKVHLQEEVFKVEINSFRVEINSFRDKISFRINIKVMINKIKVVNNLEIKTNLEEVALIVIEADLLDFSFI